ncbi:MAG TPA: MotA/TolQ/ExbB proton channel family protein [Rectinemataceae bacterium]|nr:MotA/TolQ/ExbB proton channel family protein [Rectinemataceae bacterium]
MQEFFAKGGLVLWIIVGLSALAVAIIIERLLYFRRISTDEQKLYSRAKASLEKAHFDEALAICDQNLSPFSALLRTGIENRHYPEQTQREMLKDAAAQEEPGLERHISALGTIANIAPLIGLLGTVTGTMKALGVLGRFGAVSDPSVIAAGVSEALINTVGGIIVAVLSVIFYNYLVNKVNLIILKLESQVTNLITMVNASESRGSRT